MYNRFKDFKDDILRFAFEPGVQFTNSQAERDLRGIKVKLKVSGGFRMLEGAQVYAGLLSDCHLQQAKRIGFYPAS